MFSSNRDNWGTPQEFFNKLNGIYHFTLDPCADESNHKCDKYYTKEQDGKLQDWTGETVFCNPPYGKDISSWCAKCQSEAANGATVVLLVPARTDTCWFHDYIYENPNVSYRFIRGRLKFDNPVSGKHDAAPFPSMVVVFNGEKVPPDIQEAVSGGSVMYKLYFEDSLEKRHELARWPNKTPDKDVYDGAWKTITDFCNDGGYKIPYRRMYNQDGDTVIDYGSHSTVFIISPSIDFMGVIGSSQHVLTTK